MDSYVLGHFKSEYIYRDYLKLLLSSNHKTSIIVDDPNEANIFIIDHDIAKLYSTNHCDILYSIYLPIIINNIVDNYPYYNRSYGRDHFLFATYDKGPFCDPFCEQDYQVDPSIFKRIINASFIGNYGMDKQHFKENNYNNTVSNECHRASYDIVIPQLLRNESLKFNHVFAFNKFPLRYCDSTFAGNLYGHRKPLDSMCTNNDYDMKIYQVERLICHIYVKPRMDLMYNGYFTYCACGNACWSQRLYDALAHYTIPILISDGAIQAFERIINWKKLTIKLNLNTWYNETLRNQFRQTLRNESQLYRNKTIKCLDRYNHHNLFQFIYKRSNININDTNFIDLHCNELKSTYVYNKIKYYDEFISWMNYDINSLLNSNNNIFKLIEIELFCHIYSYYVNQNEFNDSKYYQLVTICNRSVDYTARLQYL